MLGDSNASGGTDSEIELSSIFNAAFLLYHSNYYDAPGIYKNSSATKTQQLPTILQKFSFQTENNEDGSSSITYNTATPNLQQILLNAFKHIAVLIAKYNVFSPNEEMDDILTENLKYCLTPYILGHLSSLTEGIAQRLKMLKIAIVYFQQFLCSIEQLNGGRKTDFDAWKSDTPLSAAAARTQKIERHHYESQLNKAIQAILNRRTALYGNNFTWGTGSIDDDELERELFKNFIERCVVDAINQLNSISIEIPLLEHHISQLANKSESSNHPTQPPPTKKPWRYTVRSPAEAKLLYRDLVFRPSHNLPTMTLADAGDMELELERRRQISEDEAKKKREMELNQFPLLMQEREERETREWDDWKDDHPRGSGNRNRNIG